MGQCLRASGDPHAAAGLAGGATPGHPNTVSGAAGGTAILDADSNVTVDFGFYTQYLGNLVFADTGAGANYNNGQRDAGELGIGGVSIQLFAANGATEINVGPDGIYCTANDAAGGISPSNVPATLGSYQFCGLPQGQYVVKITAPAGSFSSNDRATTPTPEGSLDSDDSGIGTASGMIFSATGANALTLTPGGEPTVTNANGTTTNPTMDFGLTLPPVSIGNTVWFDTNNDGQIQPTEIGINGVKVELFLDADSSGALTGAEQTPIATQATSGSGYYLFTQRTNAAGVGTGSPLLPGNYFVVADASNFMGAGKLVGCLSSTNNVTGNSDSDNGDHGLDNPTPATGGVASTLISLVGGTEPATDGPNGDGNDANGNQTIDFGFIPTNLVIGNLIWKDTDFDGKKGATETGIGGVKVNLYRDVNRNGSYEAATDSLVTMTTTVNGNYSFTNLIPDPYFVQVDASNFAVGGPLYGCASSFVTQTGNSDANEEDHGSNNSDPLLYAPISSVINMIAFNEPGVDGDDTNGNQTIDFGFVTIQVNAIDDMGMCTGPGATLAYTFKITNSGATKQNDNPGPEFTATLPTGLVGVPGSGVSSGGGVITVTGTSVTWDGMIPAGAMVTLSYRAQVGNSVAAGTDLVVSSTVYADGDNNGTNEGQTTTTQSKKVNCAPVGPGIIPEGGSGSSVLIFPIYTSNASNPASQNTRINLTNFHASKGVNLHLFMVDGESCSVAGANICLTANQTASVLASDLDPGTTGYLMAVAVDALGCPINFNFLGGDAYTKFDSGHRGNLTAQGVSALAGGLPACDANSSIATLRFDGVSYGALPRTVALSSIGSRADGNRPLLILDRVGGNLSNSAERLGPIFGLLYDDAEKAYSFSFNPNTCQFRSELGGSFPRTTPRMDTVIGAGRNGWLKFYASPDAALIGGAFNFNDNAASQPGAFNGGHGLHTLTTTNTASVTIPVFPPTC